MSLPKRIDELDTASQASVSLSAGAAVAVVTGGKTIQTTMDQFGALGSFLQSGTGAVARTFQDKDRDIVSVKDFNAKGDGVTDDAPAFKAAMAASQSVIIPYSASPYCIGSTLGNEWANKSGCKLYSELGSGPGGIAQSAILKWIGGAGGVMFKGTGIRDSILENFVITVGAAPNTLTTAIDYDPTGETQVMTNNSHNNITIVQRGGATTPDGSLQYGIRLSRSTSPGNVSEFAFTNLFIAGAQTAGVSIEHSQSKKHRFYGPNIIFCAIGIANNLNSSSGGSLTIFGGESGSNTDTDIRMAVPDDSWEIFGWHSESSNRVFDATGAGSGVVTLQGISCAGSDALNADGQVIRFGTSVTNGSGGPINISGCDFYATESGGSFKAAKIGYAQPDGSSFVVSGCAFNNTAPFVNNGGGGAQTNFISLGNRGWNGSQYILLPTHGFNNIAKSAIPVSCPADATEDTLATITVRGNTLGKDGLIRITTAWTVTSSINNKTLRIRFSGASGTQYLNTVQTAIDTYRAITDIHNRGATNSQVGGNVASTGGLGGASGGIVTSAVDTTADTTIVITGQKATLGETLTLEAYLVEFIPGF